MQASAICAVVSTANRCRSSSWSMPSPPESDDRCQPVRMAIVLALARREVSIRECAGRVAGLAVTDATVVDLDDRRHLGAGAAEQHLVGDIELAAIDPALDDLHSQVVAGK